MARNSGLTFRGRRCYGCAVNNNLDLLLSGALLLPALAAAGF